VEHFGQSWLAAVDAKRAQAECLIVLNTTSMP